MAVKRQRTVIVSIHAPRSSIYTLFDTLMILAAGQVVYFGPATAAVSHFASIGYPCPADFNPADYLIDVVTMNPESVVTDLAEKYRQSDLSASVTESVRDLQLNSPSLHLGPEFSQEYASSFFKQVRVLSKRVTVNNLRNFYLMPLQYSIILGLSLLIGGIFYHLSLDLAGVQDRAGCIFFSIALLSFASMSSIDTCTPFTPFFLHGLVFEERPLFLRERANGVYRTSSYFVSKTLCDLLPMRIIPAVLLACITYFMVGLRAGADHFAWYLLTLVLTSIVSGSMCLAISTVVPSLGLGNLISILLLLFYLLFAGFLVNKNNIPSAINWFSYLSFLNYGFEVLMVNELQYALIWFNPADIPPSNWQTVNGNVFLAQFGMDPNRFKIDLVVLVAMVVAYLALSYILLRWATKERR